MILHTLKWTVDGNILFGHHRESGFCRSLPISHLYSCTHPCTLLSNSFQACCRASCLRQVIGRRKSWEGKDKGRRKGFCQHQSGLSIYGPKILGFWSFCMYFCKCSSWCFLGLKHLVLTPPKLSLSPGLSASSAKSGRQGPLIFLPLWSRLLGLCFCPSPNSFVWHVNKWARLFPFLFLYLGLLISVPVSEWLKAALALPCGRGVLYYAHWVLQVLCCACFLHLLQYHV